jgi:hypothetical protein
MINDMVESHLNVITLLEINITSNRQAYNMRSEKRNIGARNHDVETSIMKKGFSENCN